MTELEAVNLMLKAIGLRKVNDIASTMPQVQEAVAVLERIRKQVQARGWWFNTDYDVTYSPDPVSKEIVLAADIRNIRVAGGVIIKRGLKLYNRVDNTFQFECDVIATREQRSLEWDDMPETCQDYAAYFAAAEYVRDELEDIQKSEAYMKSATMSRIDLQREDLEASRYNVFTNNKVAQALQGVQPYSRSNVRFFGTPDR